MPGRCPLNPLQCREAVLAADLITAWEFSFSFDPGLGFSLLAAPAAKILKEVMEKLHFGPHSHDQPLQKPMFMVCIAEAAEWTKVSGMLPQVHCEIRV